MSSSLKACLALSGTIRASQKEECFLVNLRFIVLYSATKIYGTFSSRILVYSSGRQSKTMTVAHVVLETYGAFLRELIQSLPSFRLFFSKQTQYKLLMMTESEENATAFLEESFPLPPLVVNSVAVLPHPHQHCCIHVYM